MQAIVTFTINPTIDKSTAVDYVAPEIKMRCAEPSHEPGGGGINVSRAIKRLRGASQAVYTAGGPPGMMLRNLLDQEAIAHRPIEISGLTRESWTIFERNSTQQFRFGMPGPRLLEAEWRRCLDDVTDDDAGYLVLSGSLAPGVPDDFYARLAQQASAKGTRVIVDTSGRALHAVTQVGVFLLKPNLRELESMLGEPVGGERHVEEVAQALVAQGYAEVIVVSMGASGAICATAEGALFIRAPMVPIRSKVGAGDSMVAGITLALARGHSLREAACFGVAAGTAAVMTDGTQLCRFEDTARLYEGIVNETP